MVTSWKCFVSQASVRKCGTQLYTKWKLSDKAVCPTFARWTFPLKHPAKSLNMKCKTGSPTVAPGSQPGCVPCGKVVCNTSSSRRTCVEDGRQHRLCTNLKWDHCKQGGQKKHCDLVSNDGLCKWTAGKSDTLATFLSSQEFWSKREKWSKEKNVWSFS